jgi:TIR domain
MARLRQPGEVFLSHSSKDQTLAGQIARRLRGDYGVKVWFSPSHLRGADAWHDEIGKALARCNWFVVLVTPAAILSPWVRRELVFALSDRRYVDRIVPVKLRRCDPLRLSWTLRAIQVIDAIERRPAEIASLLASVWNVKKRKP